MKNYWWTLVLALSIGLAASAAGAQGAKAKPILRHVVAFKFKAGTTPEQIKQVEDAFRDLKTKVREIRGFEWGVNISPEQRNKGFTHGFIVTFTSDKDRDAYLVHPAHKAFGNLVGPVLDDVFVIDFWAKH